MKIKVTPESVRAAYIEKNLKPIRGEFGVRYTLGVNTITPHGDKVCAIGALMAGRPSDGQSIFVQAKNALDLTAPQCFAWGFDNNIMSKADEVGYENARACYELGKACWEAVKDLAEEKKS